MDTTFEIEEYYNNIRGMQETIPRPKTIYLPEDTELDKDLISQLITGHKEQVARYTILMDYYLGYASILERVKDPHKPNNKLIAPYPSYITDILTGMFIGDPPTYSIKQESEESLELLQEVFNYNDEQDENFEIAKYNSIMGVSYELVYVDEEGQIRFNELDPRQVVYVYDTKINPDPLFALYITDDMVRVFHRDYTAILSRNELDIIEAPKPNVVGKVTIIEGRNNNEKMGDFERVLNKIDAYNKAISDTANDFEEFTDSFLILQGMQNADDEDITQMKMDKVILAGEGQDAEWLTKNINNVALEDHKTRLDEDIHRFTKIPNLTDDKFGGNSSGVALKYKLLALRQAISAKERKFKRFLEDRLEIIIAYMKWLSQPIDIEHYDVEITFNSNIPIDEEANVRMVKDLMTLVSENTALSELYCVENANEEQEKKEQEQNSHLEGLTTYLGDVDDAE